MKIFEFLDQTPLKPYDFYNRKIDHKWCRTTTKLQKKRITFQQPNLLSVDLFDF